MFNGVNVWPKMNASAHLLLPLYPSSQALVSNPKIEVRDGTYGFKPKYNLKDKKALLRLLDKHDQLGLGGVLLDDVEEGLPNSAKAIKVTQIEFMLKRMHVHVMS